MKPLSSSKTLNSLLLRFWLVFWALRMNWRGAFIFVCSRLQADNQTTSRHKSVPVMHMPTAGCTVDMIRLFAAVPWFFPTCFRCMREFCCALRLPSPTISGLFTGLSTVLSVKCCVSQLDISAKSSADDGMKSSCFFRQQVITIVKKKSNILQWLKIASYSILLVCILIYYRF